MRPIRLGQVAHPQRIAAVRQAMLVESHLRAPFDRVTSLIERILEVPIAFVSLMDDERQSFVSQVGLPESVALHGTPVNDSFCQITVATGDSFVVMNAPSDALTAGSPALGRIGVAAYAGVPLRTNAGDIIGTVCAIDRKPREWRDEDLRLLEDLASLASHELEFRRQLQTSERLRRAGDDLARPARELADHVRALMETYADTEDAQLQRFGALADRMLVSVERGLRDFRSEVTHTEAPVQPAAFDIRPLLQRIVDAAVITLHIRPIEVDMPDHPVVILEDSLRVEESLLKLVLSVARHADGGEASRVIVSESDGVRVTTAYRGRTPIGELARLVASLALVHQTSDGTLEPASISAREGVILIEHGAARGMLSDVATTLQVVLRGQEPAPEPSRQSRHSSQ